MNYFTSDIHFSDLATFINDDRPFENLKEYDEFIIKLWNKTMTKNDTLYIVGDMLEKGETKVKVLETNEKWYGMTYKEDKEIVATSIRKLVDAGLYPENIMEELKK